jgi:4-amino-4-deoxy-L-arabinose transferase-like glycosyltransferase
VTESAGSLSASSGLVIARPLRLLRYDDPVALFAICIVTITGLTVLRGVFAATLELRVDEAYYWTWSRENVISYLDHPPMIAWCVRLGTLLFGDTNFGVRFTGLIGMALMQLLLADIVWRTLRDLRYVAIAVLLPEAALDYGLLMTKVVPDTALIVFALAMVWSLVRLALSDDYRWWLPAGLFGGLALLTKYTAILLLPAIIAYVVIPQWRMKQLRSTYLWLAVVIAVAIFSPVLYWNAVHNWATASLVGKISAGFRGPAIRAGGAAAVTDRGDRDRHAGLEGLPRQRPDIDPAFNLRHRSGRVPGVALILFAHRR